MTVGKYIVIEGHDGTGKSTQVEIARRKLLICGMDSIEFHEPAGSPMADAIRTVLKNGELERDPVTNLLLFTAARRELWTSRAIPALKMGMWVVASRNYFSSIAYQGYGEGLDIDLISKTTREFTDDKYMNPDVALILNLDDRRERDRRIGDRGELATPDNFESKDDTYQQNVQDGYLKIAKELNIPVVSANQTIDDMAKDIWQQIYVPLRFNF